MPRELRWSVASAAEGVALEPQDSPSLSLTAKGSRHVMTRVTLSSAGTKTFLARVWATQPAVDDAMQLELPVARDGALVQRVHAARLQGDAEQRFTLAAPHQHRAGSASLSVEVRPSLLLQMWDTLPYLVDYPYECVEQTLSRFVPAVAVKDALQRAGISLGDLAEAALNTPRSAGGRAPRVLSARELERVITHCIHNLRSAQNSDGGFGWWKDDESSLRMTRYALRGLEAAERSGCAGLARMRANAAAWLERQVAHIAEPQEGAVVALALVGSGRCPKPLLDQLYRVRSDLPTHSLAQLVSALARSERSDDARIALAQLAERAPLTKRMPWWPALGAEWAWWNARIEIASAVLTAFLDADPGHELVNPLARWIVMNRRSQGWSNTRDTAEALGALVRLAQRSEELDPDLELTLQVDSVTHNMKLQRTNFLQPLRLTIPLSDGADEPVHLRTRGRGTAYVSTVLTAMATGDAIAAQSSGINVERELHAVLPDGTRGELLDAAVRPQASQLVEITLKLTLPNDFECLLLEDPRAAGFEPVERLSGWTSAEGIRFRREVRADRTAFFISRLQQGTHHIRYRVRAETHGSVKALPARIEAMYAPEFRGNSTARRCEVLGR